jgi:hypothetical protein
MGIKKKNCSFWVFGCILFEKFVGSHKNEWIVKKTWNPLHNYQIVYDNNQWYVFCNYCELGPMARNEFWSAYIKFFDSLEAQDCLINT